MVIGTLVMAVSLNGFLIPNRIAAGGVSGLGVILFHLFGFSPGLTVFLANLPLFLLALLLIGKPLVVRSIAGAIFLPIFLELTSSLPVLTSDLLLASIYGGVGSGIGLGLVFISGGSTGGTALSAQIFNSLLGISTGQGLLGSDLAIVAGAGFFLGAEVAMYALVSLFVSSKVIDFLQDGFGFTKAALIITEKEDEVAGRLLRDLRRGATLLQGEGAYTGKTKGVILCVITQAQVSSLKKIAHEIDPLSFIIVVDAGEVLGEGFRRK